MSNIGTAKKKNLRRVYISPAPEFLDASGLEAHFGLGHGLVYNLFKAGHIKSVSLTRGDQKRGKRLFDCGSVRQFLQSKINENEGGRLKRARVKPFPKLWTLSRVITDGCVGGTATFPEWSQSIAAGESNHGGESDDTGRERVCARKRNVPRARMTTLRECVGRASETLDDTLRRVAPAKFLRKHAMM